MLPPAHICVPCKGTRHLCGLGYCPILKKVSVQAAILSSAKKNVFGPSPPNIFVGHTGYPYVSVGAMVSENEVIDNPSNMFGMSLDEIVRQRSMLYRSAVKREVFSRDRYITDMQEIVLSQVPVDVDIQFKHTPKQEVKFSPLLQPMGPIGLVDRYSVIGNPKIPKRIDSLANDNVRVVQAVKELLYRGYDNYYLMRVMSAGVLGTWERKKLVPTRWSITAMDDTLSKIHMSVIRESPEISDFEFYYSEYMSNRYVVMLIPGRWEFENFEAWAHGSLWNLSGNSTYITVEHEPFSGRSDYAESQVGGYYASRFAVTEHLFGRRRQARAIVIREIDAGYMVPVGVWQVRENVRNAFKSGPTKFSTLSDMLDYAKLQLTNPLDEYLRHDVVLKQRRLCDFL
ncbi:MAG: Nre family DNA repair protein [Candidatus Micrarchaeia archaeon]